MTAEGLTANDVLAHMLRTNPHRGARHVRGAIGSTFWDARDWTRRLVPLDELHEEPASKRDVKRYAAFAKRLGTDFPPVVLIRHPPRDWDIGQGQMRHIPPRFEIVDGAHRIAAARLLGRGAIDAYVGRLTH